MLPKILKLESTRLAATVFELAILSDGKFDGACVWYIVAQILYFITLLHLREGAY